MPASYTHQKIALAALDFVDVNHPLLRQIRQLDSPACFAYLAGAEGPDPLFFLLINRKNHTKLPKLGHQMHQKKTGDFLTALAREASKRGDYLSMAFVLGFLTHYGADTTMHPFIYRQSFLEDGMVSGDKHCKYEHILDSLFWKQEHNAGLPIQMKGYAELTRRQRRELAELLTSSINQVFSDTPVLTKDVERSFTYSVVLCRLLRWVSGLRKSILLSLLRHTSVDAFVDSHVLVRDLPDAICAEKGYRTRLYQWASIDNVQKRSWHSYWEPERERSESIYDLLYLARDRGSELLKATLKLWENEWTETEWRQVVGDNSYDSGLDWKETKPINS